MTSDRATTRAPFSSLVRVDVSALTHPGHVRPNNEDQFFVTRLTRSLETILTSLPAGELPTRLDEVNYMMLVADGMGGHAAGEVASRIAITELIGLALQRPDWIFRVDERVAPEIERRARDIIQTVGTILTERGERDSSLRGMGTTLTGARSLGRDLVIAHVGDSRAYLFRGNRLHRLTKDHTYAQLLADAGERAAGEVLRSRLRNILTNVLGGPDADVHVDVDLLRLQDGDRLLLCTDGLTDMVDDGTMAKTLSATPASTAACSALVQLALDRGGRDNVTVIVAAYEMPATPSPSA